MKKIILTFLLISNFAFADTLFGVYAGVQSWYYNNSGDVFADNAAYNSNENFDFNNENSQSISIAIEHPLPLIPNIKL